MTELPRWARVLVVVAHPDDESFGLGGVIAALVDSGAGVRVLCLTAGEASTLGESEGLAQTRAAELMVAAKELGAEEALLCHYPDGGLAGCGEALITEIASQITRERPDGLLVFCQDGGVTGHPDHEAATVAALTVAGAHRIPVLGWGLPQEVTEVLNQEYSAAFVGHAPAALPIVLDVDRERQGRAIAAHASQAVPGSVLWRRLELLGSQEHLRLVTWSDPA